MEVRQERRQLSDEQKESERAIAMQREAIKQEHVKRQREIHHVRPLFSFYLSAFPPPLPGDTRTRSEQPDRLAATHVLARIVRPTSTPRQH